MERLALQKMKLENAIDTLEAARLNEGITSSMLLWMREELREIDNGLTGIELAMKTEHETSDKEAEIEEEIIAEEEI